MGNEQRTGMEELRLLVRNFDSNNESFNDRFTPEQLLNIHRAWMASGWDIYPDNWAPDQVYMAANYATPPQFTQREEWPVSYVAWPRDEEERLAEAHRVWAKPDTFLMDGVQ